MQLHKGGLIDDAEGTIFILVPSQIKIGVTWKKVSTLLRVNAPVKVGAE